MIWPMLPELIIEAAGLEKYYRRGEAEVAALKGVSLRARRGEALVITGPSGSGKSTLLQLLGGLDRPSSGRVSLCGQPLDAYADAELSAFRRRRLGFIFQFFNLLPTLTALENVALPLMLDGRPLADVRPQCLQLLESVRLAQRAGHYPHQLSGGEMQRVAIARALVADPWLVLADEPTGNLDSENGVAVYSLLFAEVRRRGLTLLLVTHDPQAARYGDRLLLLRDGRLQSDSPSRAEAAPAGRA